MGRVSSLGEITGNLCNDDMRDTKVISVRLNDNDGSLLSASASGMREAGAADVSPFQSHSLSEDLSEPKASEASASISSSVQGLSS
jgi:hypothetical protein